MASTAPATTEHLRLAALQGDFQSDYQRWKPPESKFLLFVSSTFTDTHEERNILQGLLPELRNIASSAGLSVVFLDLRSGIPDANTLDHLTWIGCQRELLRCYEQSAGWFFLSLQGSKYGYMPIPKIIDQQAFEQRLVDTAVMTFATASTDELVALAKEWYHLDVNAIPPVYVLKNLTGDWVQDKVFWDKVLPWLRELLQGVVFDPSFPDGVIGRSVTEYEVKAAVALPSGGMGNTNRMRWLHRLFVGGVTKDQDSRQFLFDGHEPSTGKKLDTLVAWMEAELGQTDSGLTHKLSVSVDALNAARDNDQEYTFNEHRQKGLQADPYVQYRDAFIAHMRQTLTDSIVEVVRERERWNRDGCGLGIGGSLLGEMLQHYSWARMKCLGFVGREALVAKAMAAIRVAPTATTTPLGGISLSIIGRSGTGKTALMAKLASIVRETDSDRPVIIRFCGISKDSADGLSLVRSLCHQLLVAVAPLSAEAHVQNVPSSYRGAVKLLHTILAEHAVVLFIDSLDQLSDKDLARSNISFLRDVKPHPDTRIVVSALPDDKQPTKINNNQQTVTNTQPFYYYGCDTYLAMNHVPHIEVSGFSEAGVIDESRLILQALLAGRNRKLTVEQWAKVMPAVAVEPTALYLNMAMYVVSQWRSLDGVDKELRGGVAQVTEQIFEQLERDFGRELTRAALGFITWSVHGVSDTEMEDLLSLHDTVLEKVLKYCPGVKRMPSHVWLRLRGALEGLVMEGDNHCLRWYHRQLWEAAKFRYGSVANERVLIHSILGRYFADIVDVTVAAERSIRRQPTTLGGGTNRNALLKGTQVEICLGGPVWSASPAMVNQRRAVEAAEHLLEGGLLLEAAAELSDLEELCGRFKAGVGAHTADVLLRLSDLLVSAGHGADTDVVRGVEQVRRWLLLDATTIHNRPNCLLGSLRNQPCALALKTKACTIHVENNDATHFVAGRAYGGKQSFDALLSILSGHSADVMVVAWSPNGLRLASGADDRRVHIWDASTGAMTMRLEGHTRQDTSLCWNPDSSILVSGSLDGTLRVWDMAVGTVIQVMEGEGEITSVCWSCNHRVASASADGAVRVWDPITWTAVCVWTNSSSVTAVKWSPGGESLAVSSTDHSVRVFEAASWNVVSMFMAHTASVCALSWSPDGKRLVSGSLDSTLRIWDASSGVEMLMVSSGDVACTSVSWSNDGRCVASGWVDSTVLIWQLESNEDRNSLDILRGHTNRVFSVCWSPDNRRIVSGSDDETVRVWVPLLSAASTNSSKLLGHADRTDALDWSIDGRMLVSASWDGQVGLWDTVSEHLQQTCVGHTGRVRCVAVCPTGSRIASGAEDATVRVWDIVGVCLFVLSGHGKSVLSVCWNRDGQRLLSGSADSTVHCWNALTGEALWTLPGQQGHGEVNSLCWSADDTLIAVGSRDSTIRVWTMTQGKDVDATCTSLEGHNAACIYAVAWRPATSHRMLASAGEDECVILWDVETMSKVTTLTVFSDWVKSLDWTPCGTKLATASYDGSVRVWLVEGEVSCKVILSATMEVHSWFVRSVKWSPDGKHFASGSDNTTIIVWDFVSADDVIY